MLRNRSIPQAGARSQELQELPDFGRLTSGLWIVDLILCDESLQSIEVSYPNQLNPSTPGTPEHLTSGSWLLAPDFLTPEYETE
jgi:hypothetical protein